MAEVTPKECELLCALDVLDCTFLDEGMNVIEDISDYCNQDEFKCWGGFVEAVADNVVTEFAKRFSDRLRAEYFEDDDREPFSERDILNLMGTFGWLPNQIADEITITLKRVAMGCIDAPSMVVTEEYCQLWGVTIASRDEVDDMIADAKAVFSRPENEHIAYILGHSQS